MRVVFGVLAILLVLLLAGWLAPELADDPGYVLIRYRGWSLEASLLVFAVLLLVGYGVIRLLMYLVRIPRRTGQWLSAQKSLNAQQSLQQGLLELSEGEWKQAERLLSDAAKRGAAAGPAYLTAARAAQAMGDVEGRDRYLTLAAQSRHSDTAVAVTRAELLMEQGDWLSAKEILKRLRRRNPRQPHVLRLLTECYRQMGRWKSVRALLPRLRKSAGLSDTEYSRLEAETSAGLMQAATNARTLERLAKRAGKSLLREREVILAYGRRALALGSGTKAERRLRDYLDKNWNQEVLELYGALPGDDPKKRLAAAEAWLQKHPEDPLLLMTLGRLCLQAKLWGKARDYLESSIGFHPYPAAYVALAELAEENGENALALLCYRNALLLERGEETEPLPHRGEPVTPPPFPAEPEADFTERRTTRGVPVPEGKA